MVCCTGCDGKTLTALELKKKCRYNKRVGQTYDADSIAPKGLCLDAFHVAYPYCLALLYDAEFEKSCHKAGGDGSVVIQCPMGGMKMEIRRLQSLPKSIKLIKSYVEWIFRKIDYPLAVVDYRIRLKVLEVRGECKQKTGEEYWMNIRDTNKLCPAAFDAIYPFLCVSDKDEMLRHVHCPDHEGVLFKLEGKP